MGTYATYSAVQHGLMLANPSSFLAESVLVDALVENSQTLDITKRSVLFRQGALSKGIYVVRKGVVIISMATPNMTNILWVRAEPGSLLGLPALLSNEPLTLSATALAGSQVSYLDRETFSDLILSRPDLALMVLQVLASEVHSVRSAIMTHRSARLPGLPGHTASY